MNILITGATGFIGTRLTLKLAEEGHCVHALYRSEEKAKAIAHPNVSLFKGDITDYRSIEKAVKSCEVIFHMAAYARVWAKDSDTFNRINVQGTVNVMDAAQKEGVRKIVFTSTAGVLGPSFAERVSENTERTTKYFSEYEMTKALAEEKMSEYIRKGLEIVVVNPTRVYGPGILSESNGVTKMIKLYFEGKFRWIPGNGKSIGNYVYVDDVVEGHILALEKGRSGERYILGGQNISYNSFFEQLAGLTGRKLRMIKLSLSLMLGTSYLFLLRTKILGTPPLITPNWVERFLHNWEVSSDKAIKELGYHITPLDIGLRKTLNWLKE
ncbi:farnesol dehydrogenase [Ancylomarina subtilis]|uniref:Farnesol dehydrogenase n=1 Tax=Ancylomarina subtilis TaxID=1639035 RepID=A0A4Q7VII5_9BACT|nr:SDR family oxidoreductase [Ancylomarina subtilis]RZT95768.1 farnesol dehydrogenase [Ancylomarina subtilis]